MSLHLTLISIRAKICTVSKSCKCHNEASNLLRFCKAVNEAFAHDISLCVNIPLYIFFIFNLACTYHAASPPGSEQERLEFAVNSKRRVLILTLRWANVNTYLLQEEPAAVSFLEVNIPKEEITFNYSGVYLASWWDCSSLQELYGSVSNDCRMLRALKDLVPDLEKVVKLQ